MTPDEARDLLDGTTPGPWELSSSRSVDGIDIVMYDGTEMERRNVALAAAAPTLAAMVAGMRTEYRVDRMINGHWIALALGLNTTWTDDKDRADGLADLSRAAGLPTRIVRRYVTEPEEA